MGAAFLPGALAGAQVAGLLFFLNPQIPFETDTVVRGIVRYGLLFGGIGILVHLPFTWGRAQRARRILPWTLTAALAGAAILDGSHASIFAYFLPGGINVRLIKASLLLTLAALVCFYTALLHTLQRRRYGWRSRIAYMLLATASIYVMLERREAFRPRPEPSPRPSTVESAQRPVVYVVGLDGATLDAILPLAGQGRLPFLASVLRDGAHGRLSSLTPNRPLPLWETLATGKYPYKHGVVAERIYPAPFLAPGAWLKILPLGIGFRAWGLPRGDPSRPPQRSQAMAIWQMLSRLGLPTGVIGWPASSLSPVEAKDEASFLVTDRFFQQPDLPEATYPEREAERARLFRTEPSRLDPALVARFGPGPPRSVLEALSRDVWRESLTSFLLEEYRQVEGVFVELPGLLPVSERYFGGYSATQFEGSQRHQDQEAAHLLSAYYAHLDAFLSRLWAERDGPRILVVVSAYGTEDASGWRRFWETLLEGHSTVGYVDRSPDGVLLLYGTGIEAGALLTEADLVDLVPTLLYGLGFPVARDMDGEILTAAFDRSFLGRHPITFLPSYETLAEAGDR